MATHAKRSLESLVAALEPNARGGQSVAAVARTWRFAGIVDLHEVRAWLEVGVFDGHRAGLLRLVGVEPAVLASMTNGKQVGFDLAIGKLSIVDVARLVRSHRAAHDEADEWRRSG